jgi:hypothetical protein
MSNMKTHPEGNPFCKCNPCTCSLVCTCGLDKDNPVALEGTWDEEAQVMTYVVKLKPKG